MERAGITPEVALKEISEKTSVVTPDERISRVNEDPSDNAFLECAARSGAKFIVSGDRHLHKLKKFRKVKIISPREFLGMVMD